MIGAWRKARLSVRMLLHPFRLLLLRTNKIYSGCIVRLGVHRRVDFEML